MTKRAVSSGASVYVPTERMAVANPAVMLGFADTAYRAATVPGLSRA